MIRAVPETRGSAVQELIFVTAGLACVVAVVTVLIAALLQLRAPQMAVGQLVIRTTLWLVSGFFVVPVAFGIWLMAREDCPPESVCDAGAMAFAGLLMLATIAVVVSLIVGPLLANWTIRKLRNR